jgi:hypothetical protein
LINDAAAEEDPARESSFDQKSAIAPYSFDTAEQL